MAVGEEVRSGDRVVGGWREAAAMAVGEEEGRGGEAGVDRSVGVLRSHATMGNPSSPSPALPLPSPCAPAPPSSSPSLAPVRVTAHDMHAPTGGLMVTGSSSPPAPIAAVAIAAAAAAAAAHREAIREDERRKKSQTKQGEGMLSAAATTTTKRKASRVKQPKAPAAKRLKSPMVSVSPLGPANSTGIRDCAMLEAHAVICWYW
ncbi:unnamed protein product [Urochloa humidicola]